MTKYLILIMVYAVFTMLAVQGIVILLKLSGAIS